MAEEKYYRVDKVKKPFMIDAWNKAERWEIRDALKYSDKTGRNRR